MLLNRARTPRGANWLVASLLAVAGCTDHLVGFEAGYASNTIAVRSTPPKGAELRFTVPSAGRMVGGRDVRFDPDGVIVHLTGYLPMKPDSVEVVADGYELRMTLPPDLVEQASGGMPSRVQVSGTMYLPGESWVATAADGDARTSVSAWTVGVQLDAIYTGPITRTLDRASRFFGGFYSAR